MMAAAEVVFEGVTKRYGAVTAVDALSLTVPAGQLVTLLGPSGCGKTTLLRMVAGLEDITLGRILIGGRDVTALSPAERDVSLVFQSYALFPHLNVLDNAAYGLRAGGMPRRAAEAQARATLETLGLGALALRLPGELSGGQQQRVAVARALVLEPRVLLFDEPLSNLDARLRRQVREDIRALQQRLGLTVLYVTHDQQEALAVSDLIVVMSAGRIAQAGAPRSLYEAPESRFVADFMGEANLLAATIAAVRDGVAAVALGPLRLHLPARGLPPGPATLAVRPQALALSRAGAGAAAGIEAVIRSATYLGSQMEYLLETEAGTLLAIAPPSAEDFAAGEAAILRVAPERGAVLLREA
jgi:iron(III) transport system ATP-binding protein